MCWHLLWPLTKSDLISFSQALLEHNATVYMGSRSKSKAEAAIEELRKITGKEALFLELDLSSLDSVKQAANEFSKRVFILTTHLRARH